MKPSKINKTIAEALGWKDVDINSLHKPTLILGSKPISVGKAYIIDQRVPDFCNDLNAMAEAEQWLKRKGFQHQYYHYVYHIVGHCSLPLMATARQRAEAFLRTINKAAMEAEITSSAAAH